MKKIISTALAMLLAVGISTTTFAHTHLTETNPADGSTVTEAISELTLNFDGLVGEGSFVELTSSTGQDVAVRDISIGDLNMVATLAEPLSNDQYTVNWSIISADGHPLQGSYSFTVEAPVVEVEEETVGTEEPQVNEESQLDEEEEGSSSMILIIAAVFAVIIVASLIALLKRKK